MEVCERFTNDFVAWDEQRAAGRHPVRDINEVEPKF